MNHDELCRRAGKWLLHRYRCEVVLVEPRSLRTMEQPDAIGWKGNGWSVLVECKTSRADFKADAKKVFRRCPDIGLGQERWYLTPKGLLKPDEVPEGWGLVEVCGKVLKVVVPAPKAPLASERSARELGLLMSALQSERRTSQRFKQMLEGKRKITRTEQNLFLPEAEPDAPDEKPFASQTGVEQEEGKP